MQTELTHVLASKSGIEQELINNRLNAEKAERDGKQEASRLQVRFTTECIFKSDTMATAVSTRIAYSTDTRLLLG